MSRPQLPPIFIDALEPLTEEDFAELFNELEKRGLPRIFTQRESRPYASIDWLIPTGVVLIITSSYFAGIFQKIGEEHCQWFKRAVSSMYKNFLGKSSVHSFKKISAGKIHAPLHFYR